MLPPCLTALLGLLLCLCPTLALAGPDPSPEPHQLARLATGLSSLRAFCGPSQPEKTLPEPAIVAETPEEPEEQAPRPSRSLPVTLDTSTLALKLVPRQFKRHGLGMEFSELLPLGELGRRRGRPDHFTCFQRLGRGCLLDSRPDGGGFGFSLGYPFQDAAHLMLGVQAEEGGEVGKSELRTLLGLSFTF